MMIAPSYIFVTFFKMVFLVIILGALHGLFLLPVLLSLFGPGSCSKVVITMLERACETYSYFTSLATPFTKMSRWRRRRSARRSHRQPPTSPTGRVRPQCQPSWRSEGRSATSQSYVYRDPPRTTIPAAKTTTATTTGTATHPTRAGRGESRGEASESIRCTRSTTTTIAKPSMRCTTTMATSVKRTRAVRMRCVGSRVPTCMCQGATLGQEPAGE